MRIGLIARAENTGLSVQTHEFYRHMHPAKTLLVDMSAGKGRPFRPELYPDAVITHGAPSHREIQAFLRDIDVVFSAETVYNAQLYALARQAGVKVVLQPNYEFLDRNATPDLWAAPTMWHWDDIPGPKRLLPVPVATDRFPDQSRSGRATRFLHIAGRPAIHDRNGTRDLFAALAFVESEVSVTVRCQDPGHIWRLQHDLPANVELILDSRDVPGYWDNYTGDVLVMPRRFGGLCLPAQEALAAGMPVIMPAVSPNEWLPADWLVPATHAGRFQARTLIELYTVDHRALAAKIDQFAADEGFFAQAQATARQMAKELSWDALKPEYERTLAGLVAK